MTAPYCLFEVSWEVCNKVGGIHTVVSTKAKTLVGRFGDDYVAIGPWLLSGGQREAAFEEEPGFEAFCEDLRDLGVPVRVGRWKIPGRPRTILVEFSGLFSRKDEILSRLWEVYRVDSLFGDWDYVEPVLFGHAAAIVIERWHAEYGAASGQRAVAQFHEWMTGSGMLHLKQSSPAIAGVFTTHATILGRSLAAGGLTPEQGVRGQTSDQAAVAVGVRAKHSLEGTCAREADAFTTVSDVTADEAELFFQRRASPLLPNGIDLAVIDEIAGPTTRAEAKRRLHELAQRFLGDRVPDDAAMLCIAGRYEFHNKGIDVLLDALGALDRRPGRALVLFVLVPAGNSGVRGELQQRLHAPLDALLDQRPGPVGLSTHNLFDFDNDPVHRRCAALGLANRPGQRVRVIQIPVYFNAADGLLGLPYEALLRAMDLSCFPSFYEPWGYTPEESLAVGVPTVTSDCAGFGRWAQERGLGPADGVHVLARVGVDDEAAAASLAGVVEAFVTEPRDAEELARTCRETALLTDWSGLVLRYYEAFERALAEAAQRSGAETPVAPRPRVALPLAAGAGAHRPHLVRFDVAATLPEPLRGLERLVRNYWWSWDPEATAVLRDLYPAKWEATRHNAVRFLREIYPEDVRARAADPEYVARVRRVLQRFDAYLAKRPEHAVEGGSISARHPVAYFCAEFGVHESLRIYSGGLGILAGDHLKSASDLALPLVGVGLFYRMGYVRQRLTAAGEQVAHEVENDPRDLAVEAVLDEEGRPLEIELELPSSSLRLRAWKVAVGRTTLFLLDANAPANRPEDREITRQLYGGDHEHRLRQEIVLGRGGARLLARLSIEPAAWHVNEGHAAFLALERVRGLIQTQGLTFDEARELVRSTTAFTTHTPVPAGHDRFGEDLIRRYFSDAPSWVGVPWERFYALGQAEDDRGAFNMTYLALHFAGFVNGVSRLHGAVTKGLLRAFWPRLLEGELPVTSVTNGVHVPSWVDPDIGRVLGVEARAARGIDLASGAATFDARAFAAARLAAKRRLVDHVRASLEASFVERHDRPSLLARMVAGLQEDCLWIGFARRFAPYKRAQLLFRDRERLARLLSSSDRPVRVLYAGKAHPNDKHGQEILKAVALSARSDDLVGRVFFVEEYDIELARRLVQGVDVWLNNPIRPLEASGTSGMKAAANGALNLSVLDGWWIEAYDAEKRNGWSIGGGRTFANQELQDELDAEQLYQLLEDEVVPLWYEREPGEALSRGWIERVRASLATIPATFDTDRMVAEYRDRAYAPLAASWFSLSPDRCQRARDLAARRARVRRQFADVRILGAHVSDLGGVRVGDPVEVRVGVDLAGLGLDDVVVELVLGHTAPGGELQNPTVVHLEASEGGADHVHAFEGRHRIERSGSFGYGIRVRARDEGLRELVVWA